MKQRAKNGLLRALSPKDLRLLETGFEYVELHRGHVLEAVGERPGFSYFIETGLASVVAHSPRRSVCLGIIGNDGLTGLDILLGAKRSANNTVVQAAGTALRIRANELRLAFEKSASLRRILLRYVYVFMVQSSQTALTNAQASLTERLARWILMSHDRFEGDDLVVTHDFISLMLGVRRPGVTTSMHALEGKHLIRSTRDNVRVIDRDGLIAQAAESYGVCEAEYVRLIGPFGQLRRRSLQSSQLRSRRPRQVQCR